MVDGDLAINTRTGVIVMYNKAMCGRDYIIPLMATAGARSRFYIDHWKGYYANEDIVCVASGPSIQDDDIALLKKHHEAGKCKVITVNCSFRLTPWADMLIARDLAWWELYGDEMRAVFNGVSWSTSEAVVAKYNTEFMRLHKGNRYLAVGSGLCDSSSGQQAINLAIYLGARRIILIGFEANANVDKRHFFGSHPGDNPTNALYSEWHTRMSELLKATTTPIVNCSTNSAYKCFERKPLKEVLK